MPPAATQARASAPAPMHRAATARRAMSERKTNVWDRAGHTDTLANRLTTRRTELRQRQVDLADQIEVARTAYSQYETGKITPSVDKVIRLAAALDVTPEWLAFGIGDKVTTEEVSYHTASRTWVRERAWTLNERWVGERFPGIDPADLVLTSIEGKTPNGLFERGDVVIVNRASQPTDAKTDNEFIYASHREAKVGRMRRVGEDYEIELSDEQKETESRRGVRVLGEVIGGVLSLTGE